MMFSITSEGGGGGGGDVECTSFLTASISLKQEYIPISIAATTSISLGPQPESHFPTVTTTILAVDGNFRGAMRTSNLTSQFPRTKNDFAREIDLNRGVVIGALL